MTPRVSTFVSPYMFQGARGRPQPQAQAQALASLQWSFKSHCQVSGSRLSLSFSTAVAAVVAVAVGQVEEPQAADGILTAAGPQEQDAPAVGRDGHGARDP